MIRILVAAPVRQRPETLECFLRSLAGLRREGLHLDYRFVDDNEDARSSTLLKEFAPPAGTVSVVPGPPNRRTYNRDDVGHHWDRGLMVRLGQVRDTLLAAALVGDYDFIFMVDADLVLHPRTLEALLSANVEIVSQVFWTRWPNQEVEQPQVWLRGQFRLYDGPPLEQVTEDAVRPRRDAFFRQLRTPGTWPVGGLGACTLISAAAIRRGCSFREIETLDCFGEDRHFCTRAQALGLQLHAETRWPPLHLYRDADIARVPAYLAAAPRREFEVAAVEVCRRAIHGWVDQHWALPDLGFDPAPFSPVLAAALLQGARGDAAAARSERRARSVEVAEAVPEFIDATTVRITGAIEVREGTHEKSDVQRAGFVAEVGVDSGRLVVQDFDLRSPPAVIRALPRVRRTRGARVLLSMLVRNEVGRYLERALEAALPVVDEVLVVDDASDDGTPDRVAELLHGKPHQIVRLTQRGFHDEWRLRTLQWQLASRRRPDWILTLDADEILDAGAAEELRRLIAQQHADAVSFRLFDMWDEGHYRDDSLWSAHHRPAIFLARWFPGLDPAFRQTPQHCGRWPLEVLERQGIVARSRLRHMGWSREVDRRAKWARYRQLDPEGRHGVQAQYDSILDAEPNLVVFPHVGAERGGALDERS